MTGGDSKMVTFRIEDENLEEIDRLVEDGVYEDRTAAIVDSISRQTRDDYRLYQAATAVLYEASSRGHDEIEENIREHITEEFSYTPLAQLLEEE